MKKWQLKYEVRRPQTKNDWLAGQYKFQGEQAAFLVYKEAAERFFGEFACVNR